MSKGAVPPKLRWHPLSLQQLEANKFTQIVNQILDGRLSVLHSSDARQTKRVLVTDDNKDHAGLLTELLESDWGVAVDYAPSSDQCLRLIDQTSYDLLILDYRLPKRDGLWVIEELARRGKRIPVMMMTSFYQPHLSAGIRRRLAVEIYDKADGCFEALSRAAGRMLNATAAPKRSAA
ncbi:MAG: response regulator [Candidatus Zixiibacteriota bacterium]